MPKKQTLRSEEHTSELQSHSDLVCRLLLEKKYETAGHISVRSPRVTPTATDQAPQCTHGSAHPLSAASLALPTIISPPRSFFFFLNDPGTTEIYPLPPPDAFPI